MLLGIAAALDGTRGMHCGPPPLLQPGQLTLPHTFASQPAAQPAQLVPPAKPKQPPVVRDIYAQASQQSTEGMRLDGQSIGARPKLEQPSTDHQSTDGGS